MAAVTVAYGSYHFWRGSIAEAFDLYQEAVHLADRSGDDPARAAYSSAFAALTVWAGSPLVASAIDTVLKLSGGDPRFGSSVYGFSPYCPMSVARAKHLALQRRWAEAWQVWEEGLAVARAEHAAEWVAWLLSLASTLARTPEEFEAALTHAKEAVRLAEDSGNPASHVSALGALGRAQIGLGSHRDAADTLVEALDEARSRQVGLFDEGFLLADLARARLALGDPDGARTAAAEAVAVARRQGGRAVECFALLNRARIIRATDGPAADVHADLDAALVLAAEMGATAYEAEIEAERKEHH